MDNLYLVVTKEMVEKILDLTIKTTTNAVNWRGVVDRHELYTKVHAILMEEDVLPSGRP